MSEFLPLPPCVQNTSTCEAVTPFMLSFLNITDQNTYFKHYCLNPPSDSCDFGKFCPNGDVFGAFVRVSTYVTNISLAFTILHIPEEMMVSFYTQIISVYSILISTCVSIGAQSLSRLDADMALISVASPLTIYLFFYAIRSMIHVNNRMDVAFNKDKKWLMNRMLVLLMLPFWIAILVYSVVASRDGNLSQAACEDVIDTNMLFAFLVGSPVVIFIATNPGYGLAALSPLIFAALSWIVAIILRRKEIWAKCASKLPLVRIWRAVIDNYPFIQFSTVVFIPHAYWILTLEVGAMQSHGSNHELTFGAVLALFVALPPLLTIVPLLPRLPFWFIDLWWVRLLTCRLYRIPQTSLSPSPEPFTEYKALDFIDVEKMVITQRSATL